MKKILAALDFEHGTENIIEQASGLAKVTGAELILVTVEPNLPGSEGASPEEVKNELSQEFSGDVHQLHGCAEALSGQGLNCRALLLEGAPADQILQVAESTGVDMLVIGNRGRSAILDVLTGSATRDIIHSSTVPVLLVPTS